TSTSAPSPNPNVMDLSALQRAPINQLSDTKRALWVQRNLCFCCGQAGHIFRRCLNGGQRPQDHPQPSSSARISKLQAEINCLGANPMLSEIASSKNG
ncbi:uncharacterized protein VP01_10357g1, partial [Puccinia sorghi]